MSDPTKTPSEATPSIFRPRFFLAGLLLGLVLLSVLGKHVGTTDYHPGFVRFIPAVSPEGNYYPTVDEMASIVRTHCRKDQTLVIVGGNSILLGVWQPVEDVWTKHLQELLGDKFCVLNFAFRGASPSDTGGVLAEVLRKEFPHQIYIADEAPTNGVDAIGNETYRFLFWQAYFSGRLETFPIRDERVKDYLIKNQIGRRAAVDIITSNVSDGFMHFRDLWNWVGFNYVFTVPSLWGEAIPDELKARKTFKDEEPDIFDPLNMAKRYSPSSLDAEMQIVRGSDGGRYEKQPDGTYKLAEDARNGLVRYTGEAFPPDLRARTLLLISENSPYYRRQLTDDEAARSAKARVDTVEIWKNAGYGCFAYGTDYDDDDYGDRTHLSKTGGVKLAAEVAPEVQAMNERLGYNK